MKTINALPFQLKSTFISFILTMSYLRLYLISLNIITHLKVTKLFINGHYSSSPFIYVYNCIFIQFNRKRSRKIIILQISYFSYFFERFDNLFFDTINELIIQ